MKNKKLSIVILVLLTAGIIYYLLKDNYLEIIDAIFHVRLRWLFLAMSLYFLYLLFQTIPFQNFVDLYKKGTKFSDMFYIIVVTNFFNGITPLASGGQPMQVYELHRKGLSTVDSTNAVIQNSIIYQLALVLFSLSAMFVNKAFNLFPITNGLRVLAIIGLLLNLFMFLLFVVMSFSKSFNRKLIGFVINLLDRLHLIKDKKNKQKKWDKSCLQFYNNSKIILKNKKTFLTGVLYLYLSFICFYSIPFAITHALGISTNMIFITSVVMCSYVFMSSNYIPIPGATGGMEYSFINYYGFFITGFQLNSLLILWRFLTYYLPTIIGGILWGISSLKITENSNKKKRAS